ncbi:MAG: hypothetical protein BYD32DRAFT_432442 [Podila humilis]|nr:MAG: hypothetical protein BYD32DRAFT_432442 [Podila humilis]
MTDNLRWFVGNPNGDSVFAPNPRIQDQEAHEIMLVHYCLTNAVVVDMFQAYPNLHTLRLVNVRYERDHLACVRYIPANNRVVTLLLANTHVSGTFLRALFSLETLFIQADYPPWFSMTAPNWEFDRLRLEDCINSMHFLRSVSLYRVTLVGEPSPVVRNLNVRHVLATPEANNVRAYFPAARFRILNL